MTELQWLRPTDPPDAFPHPSHALKDPDGLLAIGGDLSSERLLAAYRRGIFPWYNDGQPILWWSPDPRAVIFPHEMHISRSLRRRLRRNEYSVSVDQAFAAVIADCAAIRADAGTWITPEMHAAYLELHEMGYAHSIETWRGNQLVGGIYGLCLGQSFFGESMFSRASDGSKVAMAKLMHFAREQRIELIDCQLASQHLATLGSRLLSREQFLERLDRFCSLPGPKFWSQPPHGTSDLL